MLAAAVCSTTEYRGRRHYKVTNEVDRWNFLMHHDASSTISEYNPPRGLNETKFSKGFYRRSEAAIWPSKKADKYKVDEAKVKAEERVDLRRKLNTEMLEQHGHPILNPNSYEPGSSSKKMFGHGPTPLQQHETLRRNRTSIYRFAISDRQKVLHPNRNVKHNMSSVLGIGGRDIISRGALDNFMGHGYVPKRSMTPA